MVLILTPLPAERRALAESLTLPASVHLAVGGHGKVQFALITQQLILQLRPQLVVCAGTAGALAAEIRALDVVVGESVIEHDFRSAFVRGPQPRFAADERALTALREAGGPRVHFGTIASGDEDIVDRARRVALNAQTGALAVAWEGAGLARACRLHDVPFIELRAISDAADSSAARDFAVNLRTAMGRLADVLRPLTLSR
jgi:adenosylhomocysteine nucleosidase